MKNVVFFLAIAIANHASGSNPATAPIDELKPNSLLSWIRIVALDDNRLIYACDAKDDYIAVSIDPDGDLLVATYAKRAVPATAKRKIVVTDPATGASIADYSKNKLNLVTTTVTYRTSSQIGPLSTNRSISVALDTGWLIPLSGNLPSHIRIQFQYVVGETTLKRFDETIRLPARNKGNR